MNESILTDLSVSKKEYLNPNVTSYEESLIYTKRLIVVAISNIVYLRSVFPEEVFSTRDFENLKIKIIKSKNRDSQTVINWLKGAFDALSKKYLKTLSFAIYTNSNEPDNVLETYDFHVSYGENVILELTSSKNFSEKIKLNSLKVLRTIMYSCQSLDELPDKLYINMRLFYYDDITPSDYEPPGFKSSDFEGYKYENGKHKIRLGSVPCLWHQLKFEINCSINMLIDKEDFAENMDTSIDSKQIGNQTIELAPLNVSILTDLVKNEKNSQAEDETIANRINNLKFDSPKSPSYSPIDSMKKIECFCESKKENGMNLIKCRICNSYQHSICYNIFFSNKSYIAQWENDFQHYCLKCFKNLNDKNIQPTDLSLINVDKKKLLAMSFWRKALFALFLCEKDTFFVNYLLQFLEIKQSVLNSLLLKIEKDSVVECISKKEGLYKINLFALNNLIQSTFFDPTRNLSETDKMKQKVLEKRTSIQSEGTIEYEDKHLNNGTKRISIRKRTEVLSLEKPSQKKLKSSISNDNLSQN